MKLEMESTSSDDYGDEGYLKLAGGRVELRYADVTSAVDLRPSVLLIVDGQAVYSTSLEDA